MSQRGPPSLPASRPQSRSSAIKATSPDQTHHDSTIHSGIGNRPLVGLSEGLGRPGQTSDGARVRSSIDNMLNPPESQPRMTGSESIPAQGSGLAQNVVPSRTAYGQPIYSPGVEQMGRGYPPPGPDGSRRILSPRGPRAASASFAVLGSAGSPQPVATHDALGSRPFESAPGSHPRPQLPPMSNAASLPGTPSLSVPRPARTNSQPMLAPTPVVAAPQLPATVHQRSWPAQGQPVHNPAIYEASGGLLPRSVSSGQITPGTLSEYLRGRQGATPGDGESTFTASLPGSGPIDISFDMTTASSRQSQKRSRNAEASGRHRSKRKAQTSDMQKEIQALKDAREEDRAKLDSIIRQRNFYREERNRLREVVSRTPQIARWADGPQSPVLTEEEPASAFGNTMGRLDPASEPPRPVQRHISYTGSEGQAERPLPQGESAMQGRMHPEAFARPLVSTTPVSGQAGAMHYTAPGLPPPPMSRSISATQLPPIGSMGVGGGPRSKEWEREGAFEHGRE